MIDSSVLKLSFLNNCTQEIFCLKNGSCKKKEKKMLPVQWFTCRREKSFELCWKTLLATKLWERPETRSGFLVWLYNFWSGVIVVNVKVHATFFLIKFFIPHFLFFFWMVFLTLAFRRKVKWVEVLLKRMNCNLKRKNVFIVLFVLFASPFVHFIFVIFSSIVLFSRFVDFTCFMLNIAG